MTSNEGHSPRKVQVPCCCKAHARGQWHVASSDGLIEQNCSASRLFQESLVASLQSVAIQIVGGSAATHPPRYQRLPQGPRLQLSNEPT